MIVIGSMPALRKAIAVGSVVLALVAACSRGDAAHTASSDSVKTMRPSVAASTLPDAATATDFATVSKLINDAIAADELPGAVVVIGHGGKVAFHQAYGSRKLSGEPGLDGSPAPAEPMTEDTIFDLASVPRKASQRRLPSWRCTNKAGFSSTIPCSSTCLAFNSANDPRRAQVTVRMLLTHACGETGDVDLERSVGTGPGR